MREDCGDEAAWRQAIADGDSGAWSGLGRLLSDQPGREHEAQASYREVIAAGNGNPHNSRGYLRAIGFSRPSFRKRAP